MQQILVQLQEPQQLQHGLINPEMEIMRHLIQISPLIQQQIDILKPLIITPIYDYHLQHLRIQQIKHVLYLSYMRINRKVIIIKHYLVHLIMDSINYSVAHHMLLITFEAILQLTQVIQHLKLV